MSRSDAARRGWETRRDRARAEDQWDSQDTWIFEEPIEEVGDQYYG